MPLFKLIALSYLPKAITTVESRSGVGVGVVVVVVGGGGSLSWCQYQ